MDNVYLANYTDVQYRNKNAYNHRWGRSPVTGNIHSRANRANTYQYLALPIFKVTMRSYTCVPSVAVHVMMY